MFAATPHCLHCHLGSICLLLDQQLYWILMGPQTLLYDCFIVYCNVGMGFMENVVCLRHPRPTPPLHVSEGIVSHEALVLKKLGDPCPKSNKVLVVYI